ncbi:hypothetical protein, partial [Rhizobium sophoriradicis]|uniref:hypothetical protein n=2 Tax=Rhizobium sophoriradicis TaxID=1535245 RepID=UPI001AEFE9DE
SIMLITPDSPCGRKVRMSCFCKVGMSHSPHLLTWEIADGIDSDATDEQIIIVQGHSCGRAIYFRRKDMDAAAEANCFVKSTS